MKFLSKYAGSLGIAIILLLFILAKLPDLSLPYFWDELGVYAPGALNMKDTGHFGLLPSCMDPELSRGHPLLSYLGYAVFYKLFGATPTVGHAFTLLLASLTLFCCYRFTRPAFGRMAALCLCALLAVQPLFFAMAGIVMPEMMLTLFSVIAIWALITKRWLPYLASAIACVLIKEAGIVIPATALLYTGIECLRERRLFTGKAIGQLAISFLPLLAFAGFLWIQKQQNGWYFFPLHTHLMRHNLPAIWRSVLRITQFVFIDQGRWILFLFMCGGLITNILKPVHNEAQRKWLLASGLFIFVAVGFAAPNYHLVRYILYVLPFYVLIAAWGMSRLAALLGPQMVRLGMIGGCVAGLISAFYFLSPPQFADNADMSYKFLVQTEKQCINWAEKQPWHDSTITANFPVNGGLMDQRCGYLKTRKSWKMAIQYPGFQFTKYGIYFWRKGENPPSLKNGMFYELKRFQNNDAIFSVMMAF